MNKKIESLFTIITLSLITLLTGCNSESAFNSTDSAQPDEDATLVEIAISPSPVLLAQRNTQQLTAIGKYDDGTEVDISNTAEWAIVDDPTLATITTTGLLTAGTANGEVKVVANKAGIFSEEVTVTVIDLGGAVIDIFDTGSGKLFTNNPSKAYLDSIKGSTTSGTREESGTYGPVGVFYLFNWYHANTLCDTYSAHSLGGRTNWRLAELDELKIELYGEFSNMFIARGWPTTMIYWSATSANNGFDDYYYVDLISGLVSRTYPGSIGYASCVSNP